MNHDLHLQKAVLAEIAWEPSVTAAHIGVTASAGVVTLTGHVESYAQKLDAEAAARRVKGVKAIAEEIEVQLPFDRQRGDSEIAAAIIERLSWDVSIPRDRVSVKVENGWVTLGGEVDWQFEKLAAEDEVRRLHGVVGLSNQMTIRPVAKSDESADHVSDRIMLALQRSWFVDAEHIKVSAKGGRVHLTGTVHSPHDRLVAASTAWSAPGVTSVENDITIV